MLAEGLETGHTGEVRYTATTRFEPAETKGKRQNQLERDCTANEANVLLIKPYLLYLRSRQALSNCLPEHKSHSSTERCLRVHTQCQAKVRPQPAQLCCKNFVVQLYPLLSPLHHLIKFLFDTFIVSPSIYYSNLRVTKQQISLLNNRELSAAKGQVIHQ